MTPEELSGLLDFIDNRMDRIIEATEKYTDIWDREIAGHHNVPQMAKSVKRRIAAVRSS